MADPEQIEQELRAYVSIEKNLSREDRVIHLRAIFDKHFAMDKTDHLLNNADFQDIISRAKALWVQTSMPFKISKREVRSEEVNHYLIIEAFVSYLNKNKLLKRLVRFDITR